MPFTLKSLHPMFAAEVGGIELRDTLSPDEVKKIEKATDCHAVLVFRGQPLTQGEQIAFSRNFGPLNVGLRKATGAKNCFDYDELIDISNVAPDGSIASRHDGKLIFQLANQLWHSDSSFQQRPIKYSMLSAVVVPAEGGETEFVDLRAAYDALPDATKQLIEGLEAEHSAFHSRSLLGDTQYTEEQIKVFPSARWRLIRIHPGSQRKV